MTNTFTTEHRNKLEQYLATHELSAGIGSEESACSIAAINLAVSGELTDDIPPCMSAVLGSATIRLQDVMPDEIRNNDHYKKLLPDMAGTGRDKEDIRLAILMDWMWSVVLPKLQPLADDKGFSTQWRNMCQEKTSADAAYDAAYAAYGVAAYAARDAAAYAARAAARAAYAARDAARAYAARDASRAAAYAADAACDAACAYDARAADANFWKEVDPIGVLERMTYLKGGTK